MQTKVYAAPQCECIQFAMDEHSVLCASGTLGIVSSTNIDGLEEVEGNYTWY